MERNKATERFNVVYLFIHVVFLHSYVTPMIGNGRSLHTSLSIRYTTHIKHSHRLTYISTLVYVQAFILRNSQNAEKSKCRYTRMFQLQPLTADP